MADLQTIRHSCSHVMAQAVKDLFADVKVTIGPAIEDGFYYDFDCPQPFTPEDLPRIEARMKELVAEKLPFVREVWPKPQAIAFFRDRQEPYKLELIDAIPDETVSVYKTGDTFWDLCRGPHVGNTSEIGAFKLLSIAGAYWRGDERNPMLQRIYGTCFATEKELKEFLHRREEALKRDHRKLGPQLKLFDMLPEIGAGLVLYHPRGAVLRTLIEDYEKLQHRRNGYQLVIGPHILKSDIWVQSGHYDYYKENMYTFDVDGQEFALKPMNCPGHIMIYKSAVRSYRELPLRLFELGTVYRHEKSGVLHGLLRVRGFTQDDAHLFCAEEHLKDEIKAIIDFVAQTMTDFGFPEWQVELSTRPEKSIGSDRMWESATTALTQSLQEKNLPFEVNAGDGAFYGPKIDIKLKDAIGRQWQCATIQCDFALPERFDLTYIGADGKAHRPIMLHRVLLGSLERFMGALIEHYAGSLPVWLSPVQAVVIAVTEHHHEYARQVYQRLTAADVRAELDVRNEKVGFKIREAVMQKIPYILVLGEKEQSAGTVSVRYERGSRKGTVVNGQKTEDFISEVFDAVAKRVSN